jgi:hypothetical protein
MISGSSILQGRVYTKMLRTFLRASQSVGRLVVENRNKILTGLLLPYRAHLNGYWIQQQGEWCVLVSQRHW